MRMQGVPLIALLLAGCGGGGEEAAISSAPTETEPAAPTQAPGVAPAPPMSIAPAPIVAPVNPGPVKTPVGLPPAAPAPQPAEGAYILGKIVKAAMASGGDRQHPAYEVDPATGLPDMTRDVVWLSINEGASSWFQQNVPAGFKTGPANAHSFPQSSVLFSTSYGNEGHFTLGQQVTSGYAGDTAFLHFVRSAGSFEIRDDSKFILNTTAAEWRGVDGSPYFIQLQISTSAQSNTVFKLCLHRSLEAVKRLSCTLHSRDSGAFRGVQIIDDSVGLGAIEYRTAN